LGQMFCLAQGWSEGNSLRALQRAAEAGLIEAGDARLLLENYRNLRRIEGILRRWSYEGETLLPEDEPAQNRVAVRCGYAGHEEFMEAVAKTRGAIHSVYVKHLA